MIALKALWISVAPKKLAVWMQSWLLIYFLAGIAAACWIKPPYRFGLRALLILTAIVALLCFIAAISNRAGAFILQ